MQGIGPQLVQAKPTERDQEVVAPHATEAGQGKPLEDALEAPLWRPGRLAGERRLLCARVRGEAPIGKESLPATSGVVRRARPQRDLLQVGDRARSPAREERLAGAGEGLGALQRREIGGEEAHPGGLLDVPAIARL